MDNGGDELYGPVESSDLAKETARRVDGLSKEHHDHVRSCAAQFKAMVGIVLAIAAGGTGFLVSVARDIAGLQQSMQYVILSINREHEDRVMWQRDQSVAAGETRKLIDALQAQVSVGQGYRGNP